MTSSTTTSPSTAADPSTTTPRVTHFGLAVLALAMGGFAIGTTEFVSMGLLPELAEGIGVTVPTAGHLISAYALGVVVGAPLIAFLGARLPRRQLLIMLMIVFALGNAVSAVVDSYPSMLLARFVSGLPHGAYFGVASLVAAGLAAPGKKGRAVSLVMLGLAVSNVLGVPAATWLGQHAGWRSAYLLVAVLGALTVALVVAFVPRRPGQATASRRGELRAFGNPQVLLALLAGAIGFGGIFSMYTYIAPTVTEVAGLPASRVPVYLLVFGLGMVVGTSLAGRMADWSVMRSLLIGASMMGVLLAVFTRTAEWFVPGLITVFLLQVFASVLVLNLQMRLMRVAGDAQSLGAAMNHASLNMANALGAWLGGVVVAAGYGYRAPSWVGVGLSAGGLVVILISAALERSQSRR